MSLRRRRDVQQIALPVGTIRRERFGDGSEEPGVIYAGMWHVLRRPWAMTSGGTGDDGLYRSSDGGRTWKEVTGNGFPAPPIGRFGVTIAPRQPMRLRSRRIGCRRPLALRRLGRHVEDGQQGFAGEPVTVLFFARARLADRREHRLRGQHVSRDLLQRRREIRSLLFGVHPDLHDMWISSDGNRMALAGDGGIAISANGGATWSNSRNIAIGQVYRVGLRIAFRISSAADCRTTTRTAARRSTATPTE